jgi:hypothetical protein
VFGGRDERALAPGLGWPSEVRRGMSIVDESPDRHAHTLCLSLAEVCACAAVFVMTAVAVPLQTAGGFLFYGEGWPAISAIWTMVIRAAWIASLCCVIMIAAGRLGRFLWRKWARKVT